MLTPHPGQFPTPKTSIHTLTISWTSFNRQYLFLNSRPSAWSHDIHHIAKEKVCDSAYLLCSPLIYAQSNHTLSGPTMLAISSDRFRYGKVLGGDHRLCTIIRYCFPIVVLEKKTTF